MEYQHYNDNFLRYRTEGYKKQVKRKIENHDRILKHFKIQKQEAELEIETLEERLGKIEIQRNELMEKFKNMQIEHKNLVEYAILNKIKDEQVIKTLNLQERKIYETSHTLIEYDNEKYSINYQIKFLKLNIFHMKKWINEEKERKSKIAIC